ncbi:tRNA CCA-pyrophosphorylase [Ligilactobacillus salitolerans]|uniref:CCA-adding enzyme n=1 Tax=Ligilactobacillus salitolerans TaxID=1808352 RepID=A0A401ITM4_9LACO|nr:CCA tRNA nucleotidyltransferase [Ligilactobacillus salitolerans]GBG94866.1 tRNA CCA-pyrophosphorylase [Ligilactobacillus salitolerans]
MRVAELPQKFIAAKPILEKLTKQGYEAYFVGGSVRDTLLHQEIHDVDIATSAYPAEVKAIFKHTVDTGIKHGTIMVLDHGEGYEITTFRTESGYQDFRRPDHVTFVRSLKEDLKRRDLTINALAMDPSGQVIDLFGGLDDLKAHVIRAVGVPEERFHEDALRMMRAVRFVSQLGFKLEQNTRIAITANAKLLDKIAVERIHVEWVKLLQGKQPQLGLQEFLTTGMYQFCPGLGDQQKNLAEIAALKHLLLTSEEMVWVLLSRFFGYSPAQARQMLIAWKSSNQLIGHVIIALNALGHFPHPPADVLYQTGLPMLLVANQVAWYDGNAVPENQLKEWYAKLPIKSSKELALTGKDLLEQLNLKPGPQLGAIIKKTEQLVINGQLANDKKVLLRYAQTLLP